MTPHGLFSNWPPPSKEILKEWLDRQSIIRDDSLKIVDMDDGDGWRLLSGREMDIGELICSIPKTSILSHRTSSLPPLPPLPSSSSCNEGSMNSITILHLSLRLLHEYRLGEGSPFYGYLQSLPRDIIGLPIFWDLPEICGEDGKEAKKWLRGTEAERELRVREEQGLRLSDLQLFYSHYSSHLPPTTSHPQPSPIQAFYHAFSLISTRAFMIDLYHLIALCPFADILNHHPTLPNTSLSSDDFVCHLCGSLKTCPEHDITNSQGIAYRLLHLIPRDIQRIEDEPQDTIELRVERPIVKKGEEVWNSYGDGLSDAKLLVEWGFLGEEYTGDGLVWDLEDLHLKGEGESEGYWELFDQALNNFIYQDSAEHEDEEERILCGRNEQHPRLLNLDQSGRISINIFSLLWLNQIRSRRKGQENLKAEDLELLLQAIKQIESIWKISIDEEYTDYDTLLIDDLVEVIQQLIDLLKKRIGKMYRCDSSEDALFKMRDDLPQKDRYQYMAMTLSINERVLINSTLNKWNDLLDFIVASS
ncbi:hypothetical protein I204_07850 [Kwoniella mangroviensis CBS 8886]|uniref:hypothetical protein n=1 Tax=Kwoniella mangroviensis CBS 8507 TaxID=1296122 RepID=UPI00080CDAF1|nr:uncharacterized protein I203_05162 [Kwoniella mangroviensis CBS 8507]OCF65487.1 hypothetical protein I203_05162 [Kwoniella mangroviensis CBS 8507]OCF71787.1 hypothetical protein I204_07850 [Kwoniella mangroviensis CBS 8886]